MDNRVGKLSWITLGGNNKEKIGANTHVLVYEDAQGKKSGLMIDAGSYFSDPEKSGFSLLVADPRKFLDDPDLKLVGHVFTHAHEDHIGGYPRWAEAGLKLPPAYASPLTKSIIIKHMIEDKIDRSLWPRIGDLQQSKPFKLGPFEIEAVPVSHSLSQSSLLRIKTPAGTICHSGDLKGDQTGLFGPATDFERLAQIGDQGVDVLLMESTNTLSNSPSVPEADVRASLGKLVAEAKGKRVIAAMITRNTERFASLAEAAAKDGRTVVLQGKSLETVYDAMQRSGLDVAKAIGRDVKILSARDAAKQNIPPGKQLIIVTGTQGGDMGVLPLAARGEHRFLQIGRNDRVIMAQSAIPGNETPYAEMVGQLRARGAEVITPKEALTHTSGHWKKDEWAALVGPLKPKTVIPIHGGPEQIDAHLAIIKQAGMNGYRAMNLDVVEFGADGPKTVAKLDQGLIGYAPLGEGQRGFSAPVYGVHEGDTLDSAKRRAPVARPKAPAFG